MKHKIIFSIFGALLFAVLVFAGERVARADTVITNCSNDSQLTTALASGGIITFNCGTATITFSGQKNINVNTTIDGGGKITLSGNNATRLFNVNAGKSLTLKNLVVKEGNAGSNYGGCIYVDNATLFVQNTIIQNCKTNDYAGGAIVAPNSNVTLDHAALQQNSASSGAGVSATGTLTIHNSVVQDNLVTNGGGGISAGGIVNIDSSLIRDNRATGVNAKGGGIAIVPGTLLNVTTSTLSGNSAINGGAISNDNGTVTVTNSTFSFNLATNGGAIANYGILTLAAVTINGNIADAAGSGLYNTGTATLTNVTLSGNTSTGTLGASIYSAGPLTLVNDTLSGNSAAGYGGIYYDGGGISIKNTLIAKGANGANCNGNFGGALNLSDDNSCNFGGGRDGVALNLGPLANNGTLLKTHLPKTGSPAIDSGYATGAPTTDARGYSRPQGQEVDVGAVEVCAAKPTKPTLTSPLNNKKQKGLNVSLDWNDTLCADKYKITVKDAASGAKVQGGSSGTSDFKTKALTKGKSYLWYVQACNTIGCTKSDTWKFTVK